MYIKDYEIKNDEMITFSVWAVAKIPGLLFNLESDYISSYGRYVGRKSLSVKIQESQLNTIEAYIDRNDQWTLGKIAAIGLFIYGTKWWMRHSG